MFLNRLVLHDMYVNNLRTRGFRFYCRLLEHSIVRNKLEMVLIRPQNFSKEELSVKMNINYW